MRLQDNSTRRDRRGKNYVPDLGSTSYKHRRNTKVHRYGTEIRVDGVFFIDFINKYTRYVDE